MAVNPADRERKMEQVLSEIRTSLAVGLSRLTGSPVEPHTIRLPAKGADGAWPGAIRSGADAEAIVLGLSEDPGCFLPVYGLCPVASVTANKGWVLFGLNKALFDTALAARPNPLPPESPEDGILRLKLFMLARHEPGPIPDDPALRRALLLLWAAEESPSPARVEQAIRALLHAPLAASPTERPQYAKKLGGPARLALSLSFRSLSSSEGKDNET